MEQRTMEWRRRRLSGRLTLWDAAAEFCIEMGPEVGGSRTCRLWNHNPRELETPQARLRYLQFNLCLPEEQLAKELLEKLAEVSPHHHAATLKIMTFDPRLARDFEFVEVKR